MADVAADLRLHYVHAGKGERTIVLLHGFPQTWWEWNRVIPRLAGEGFRVVAPVVRAPQASSHRLPELFVLLKRHLLARKFEPCFTAQPASSLAGLRSALLRNADGIRPTR